MSVSNGQPANATTFNNAYVSRTVDSNTVAKVDLDNADTTDIKDVQRVVNEQLDASGVANQVATDANAKVYSSNNVITDGDNRKVAIGKLDAEFDTTTGHDHDGVNSKAIDGGNLGNMNLLFAEFQENTFDAASGTSIDVSALFAAKTAGGDSITEGVITSAPLNMVSIVEKTNGGEIEDAQGDRVYARLTEAAGVWTLSFYTNEAGTETAHNLSSQDISFLYREVFNQATRPTIGANVAAFDTLSAVGDIPDASPTQAGKVTTSAQTFAGNKNFQDGLEIGGIGVMDLSSAQTVTNKTMSSSTLSSDSIEDPTRLDVKKDTEANLITYASSATNGQLCFATDTKKLYQVLDLALSEVGAGSGGGGTSDLDIFLAEDFSTTVAADFATGNNASFLGGGSLAGTLVDNLVTPIAGINSLTYTQAVGSLNDYAASPIIDIDRKQAGNTAQLNLYYTYDGDPADIQVIIYDVDNATVLTTSSNTFLAASNPTRYEVSIDIPDTVTQIRYGIQVLVENIGAILEIDDIQLTNFIVSSGGSGGGGTAAIAVLRDEKAGGAEGGTFTAGSWVTRVLNVQEGGTDFCTLSSNQITLDPGVYYADFNCTGYRVNHHQSKLQNITSGLTQTMGSSCFSSSGSDINGQSMSFIKGYFQIAEQSTFEVQHWCQTTKATNGFGIAIQFDGENTVFTTGAIQQISAIEPPVAPTQFAAVLDQNTDSIVSQSGAWLDSITTPDGSTVTLDYTSAGFTNPPVLIFNGGSRTLFCSMVAAPTNTGVSVKVRNAVGTPGYTVDGLGDERLFVLAYSQD